MRQKKITLQRIFKLSCAYHYRRRSRDLFFDTSITAAGYFIFLSFIVFPVIGFILGDAKLFFSNKFIVIAYCYALWYFTARYLKNGRRRTEVLEAVKEAISKGEKTTIKLILDMSLLLGIVVFLAFAFE